MLSFKDRLPDIKMLYNQCQLHHHECSTHQLFVPSRLIHIRGTKADGLKARLVERQDLKGDVRYTTLSYRWGLGHHRPYRTLKDNISEHKLAIPWELLTVVVQDALLVTHTFDMAYLWVDSLCIVQDDQLDWQEEAARMGSIFTNSELTIVACNVSESRPNLTFSAAGPIIYDHENEIAVRSTWAGIKEVTKSTLYNRGWVFQEVLLSRRRLNFCDSQVYWHCRQSFYSEDGTLGGPGSESHPSLMEGTEDERWHTLIKSYTKTALTYITDRPLAIVGPTELERSQTNKTPVLGLWLETLSTDLAWDVGLNSHDIPLPNCPSWSWLSVDGRIKWPIDTYRPLLEILHCEVLWVGEAMVSPLAKAELKVRGQFGVLDLSNRLYGIDPNFPWDGTQFGNDSETTTIHIDGCLNYSDRDTLRLDTSYRLLLVGQTEWESEPRERVRNGDARWKCEILFIVLKQMRGLHNECQYKRIGHGSLRMDYDLKDQTPVWPEHLPCFQATTIDLI